MKERNNRKKSIMIRGIRTVGRNIKAEVKSIIKGILEYGYIHKRDKGDWRGTSC